MPTLFEQSAGFIVYRINRKGIREYLILHYPGGHFDFPKGHIEKGETKMQAAERELEEETGITRVTWIEGYKEKINYKYRREGQLMSKDVYFFLAATRQKNVRISFEHQGFVWLPFNEAMLKITFDNARTLLTKAEEFISEHPNAALVKKKK